METCPNLELIESLDKDEGLTWAEKEFLTLNLGDKRLEKRLKILVDNFIKKPGSPIPQICGNWAGAKAAYRFFNNSKVSSENIIESHRDATIERAKSARTILAINDTSSANYSSRQGSQGLGPISSEKDIGLMIHPTIALDVLGTPLGIIDFQIWAREVDIVTDKDKKWKPIEEKESYKWLRSYLNCCNLEEEYKGSIHYISVCDREGDIFELFLEYFLSENKFKPDLLVRAARNRCVEEAEKHLWEQVKSQNVAGKYILEVPRRKDQPSREANLFVKFCEVTIKPAWYTKQKASNIPIKLNAIFAYEEVTQEGVEPISWMLLTTCSVKTFEEALEKIDWYTKRWSIELFFKVLKTGCQIEERQLQTGNRLKSCITIDAIIAQRVLFLTYIGRDVPDMEATVIFEDYEWKALHSFIHSTQDTPDEVPTLQTVIFQIGKLGGFLGRKKDGPPGMISIFKGLWRLNDISHMWRVFKAPHWGVGGPTYG